MTTEDSGIPAATAEDHPGPGETAEATIPTVPQEQAPQEAQINWPGWLEEYRALAQAEWDATENVEDLDGDASQRERRILTRASEDATDRLEEFVATIAGTEGNSLEALAVKLAVEWSHHVDFPDLSEPMDSEQLLIRTSLDYLAVQTGLNLFVCHDRNGRWLLGRSDETDNEAQPDDGTDATLTALEQEHDRRWDTKFPEDSKEADENTDRIGALAREIATRTAHTVAGALVKLRVMRAYQRHSLCDWYGASWDTALEALTRPAGLPVPTVAIDNPDATLFALEVEMKAAFKGLAADPGDNEAHQVWYDRMEAAEKATLAIPAQTPSDVAAKLRIFANYQNPKRCEDDEVFDVCIRHVIEEAQRISATVPAKPDTELQSLWSQHQALCEAWPADATDDESDKHGNRIKEIELQIAATPADSLASIAVKLQVAAIDVTSIDDVPCARNVMSARDDAVRLSGIGGAA